MSDNTEPTEVENTEIAVPGQHPDEVNDDQGELDERDPMEGPTELESLKMRAKTLGINFSPNLKDPEVLRARINEHIEKLEESRIPKEALSEAEAKEQGFQPMPQPVQAAISQAPRASDRNKLPPMSEMLAMDTDTLLRYPESKRTQIIRARQQFEQLALLRCQIYNNNPAKNDLHGEIFSVQNKYLGVVRKYVPYGEFTENGYHLPLILVNMLRGKKYLQVRSVKNRDGTERTEQRQAPEFTITVLPPLTRDELGRLAASQGARISAEGGLVGMN